jgi:hypothetical protein
MSWEHQLKWEDEKLLPGAKIVRLCGNPNATHTGEHWPRITVLDLLPDQFKEFDDNPFLFTYKYNLYPDPGQQIQWISQCAKPVLGVGIPMADTKTRWTVIIIHGPRSAATCAAMPQTFASP